MPNDRVSCRFDTEEVIGVYVDTNRVVCVQPFMLAQGYVRFEISVGTEKYKWKGRYFVGEWTPAGVESYCMDHSKYGATRPFYWSLEKVARFNLSRSRETMLITWTNLIFCP